MKVKNQFSEEAAGYKYIPAKKERPSNSPYDFEQAFKEFSFREKLNAVKEKIVHMETSIQKQN